MSLMGALKSAVCDRLRSDNAVTALLGVGERIFDITPNYTPADLSAACPYIYIGAVGGAKEEQHGAALRFDTRIRLYCVTDSGDRDSVWDIAEAAMLALDGCSSDRLGMKTPHAIHALFVENCGDVVDPLEQQMVFIDLRCTAEKQD